MNDLRKYSNNTGIIFACILVLIEFVGLTYSIAKTPLMISIFNLVSIPFVSIPIFIYLAKKKDLSSLRFDKFNWIVFFSVPIIWMFGMLTFLFISACVEVIIPTQISTEIQAVFLNLYVANPTLYILAIVFVGPIFEEIIFRGFLFNRLKKTTSTFFAILVSSFLFGIYHANLYQAIPSFFAGIIMCLLFDLSDSIYPSIFYHILTNGIPELLALNSPYVERSAAGGVQELSPAITKPTGMELLDSSIITAGIVSLIVLIVLFFFLAKLVQKNDYFKNLFVNNGHKLWSIGLGLGTVWLLYQNFMFLF